jgi:hypothetical protein
MKERIARQHVRYLLYKPPPHLVWISIKDQRSNIHIQPIPLPREPGAFMTLILLQSIYVQNPALASPTSQSKQARYLLEDVQIHHPTQDVTTPARQQTTPSDPTGDKTWGGGKGEATIDI